MVRSSDTARMAKAKSASRNQNPAQARAGSKPGDLGGNNKVTMAPVASNRSAGQTRGMSLRFKECERVSTILGSTPFAISGSLACNPGLAASFPWLSGHAQLFERYRIHRLVYRYKNLKGTASNGNILMSFDYDTLDNAPASAIEMTQSTVYVDGAPWRIFELDVPTDKRDLFTRSGTPVGSDLKTYDMGKLHIAAEGCADNSPHGYLEVQYDVELFMKQSITTGANNSGLPFVNLTAGATIGAAPAWISLPSGTSFIVQPGTYLIHTTGALSGFSGLTPNTGISGFGVGQSVCFNTTAATTVNSSAILAGCVVKLA